MATTNSRRRSPRKSRVQTSETRFGSKVSQDNTGYYILLDFETFVAPTNLSATHVPYLFVKLERRWIWSAQNPSERVLHYVPASVRQTAQLAPNVTSNITDVKRDEAFLNEYNERHDDVDRIHRFYEEETQEIRPEAITVQPPTFAFSEIPFNRSMFRSTNIYYAEICYKVIGKEPESPYSILPFNPDQCIAGFAEETRALNRRDYFETQEVERKSERQSKPKFSAVVNSRLKSQNFVTND